MARIFTYNQDTDLDLKDKVIGSNSGDNVTKNYSVQSVLDVANTENFIKQFDGIVFKAQDYNNDSQQFGIITTGTGTYTSTNFADIQTLNVSFKNLNKELVDNYIDVLAGYDVRITKKGDINNFGIYRVDNVSNGINNYKILALTNQDASGQLEAGAEYYISTLGNNLKNLNSFSVTSLNDVTSAGSGAIITDGERVLVGDIINKVAKSDVIDNLTSTNTIQVLSANQGRVLKGFIDSINALLTSDNVDLDSLQEVVDYIEANKSTLDNLSISNIAGLQTALDGKVDKVTGKGLSANDFTDSLQTKLNNIAAGAEVNVQANWNESSNSSDAFIQNKPTDITNLSTHNVTELQDVTSAGSGSIITSAERTKLTGIDANAEQNVQSNWNETDSNADSFIQNKPVITNQNTTITVAGTANEIETSPSSGQDLSANRTFTIGLPNNVTITNNLTADNVIVDDVLSFTTAQTSVTEDNAIYFKTENSHDILNFRYHDHELPIDTITEGITTGITSGGVLSKASNTQFSITAGTGIVNDLNKESSASKPYPEIKHVSWSNQTVTCTGLDTGSTAQKNTWIYIDVNGVINQQTSNFTDAQKSNNIIIGSIIHTSGTIDFVKTFPITAYGAVTQIQEFTRIFGPLKKSGHKVTANGANLKLNRAAGVAWSQGRNYSADPNNPSLVSDAAKTEAKIHRYYSDGSTSHTLDTNDGAGHNDIDNTKYDNGSGTLQTMGSSKFSVQRLFYFPTTPDIIVAYYGKAFYNSIDDAERSYNLEEFTEAENTAAQAIYLGAIVVKGGNSVALNNTAHAKILTSGVFRSLAATSLGGSAAAAALSDLSDVNVTSASNNQFLKYNGTNGRFENATITTDTITEGSTNLYDKTVSISNGSNITVTGTYPNFTVASAHPNISAATSADNSGLTFLQDLTLDSNGHVTGLVSTTVATEAIAQNGTGLASADDIYQFVTGLGYLTANQSISLTGDVTGSGATSITTTIAADAIHHSMLNDDIISGQAALTSGLASTDEFAISDNGVVKKMDVSVLQSYLQSNLTFTSNTDADVSTANLATRLGQLTGTNSIGGNVTVAGNLVVSGTTTTVNSETITLNDNIIVLNNNYTGSSPSENGGIEVERGTQTNASLLWMESQDRWYAGLNGAERKLLTTDDEGSGNGLDADTVDGNEGAYYLNYSNFTNTPTIPSAANNATITLTAGTGLSGGQAFTTNQSSDETITFALDFSELTDMTADIGASTEFIVQNSGTESRKAAEEISLKYFRNDIDVSVQNVGGNNKYFIDGTQQADITLQPGFKYRFTHPSAHPFRFSTDSNNSSAYTAGVTTSSTYTEILVEQDTPSTLYYYCSNHGNMGGTVYVGAGLRTAGSGLTGTRTVALDVNGLSAESTIADADTIVFYDDTASAHKKITKANFVTATALTGGNGVSINSGAIDNDADQRSVVTHIGATTSDYYRSINTGVHEWYGSGALNMQLEDDGDLLVRKDVVAFSTVVASDKSLKDNIKTIHKGLDTVNKLRGVEFDWNYGAKEGQHDIGVVAQEVEKVIPEIVYSKKLIDDKEIKTVDYEKLTAVLIEAVKELSQEVTELKKQING